MGLKGLLMDLAKLLIEFVLSVSGSAENHLRNRETFEKAKKPMHRPSAAPLRGRPIPAALCRSTDTALHPLYLLRQQQKRRASGAGSEKMNLWLQPR